MIWLGVLCAVLVAALVGWIVVTERQMREMARVLAYRARATERLRLRFPTAAVRHLAREANGLLEEIEDVRLEASEERRRLQKNLASFSHDVRTPLAGAQGYLQLYAVAATDEERDECVTAAAERLAAMRGLVDALFEYAKADDGSRELALAPVDVGETVAACLAELYPAFAERGWEPAVALDADIVVEADPEALGRIVENLLVNCLRHGCGAPAIALRRELGKGTGGESALKGNASAECARDAHAQVGSFALTVSNEAEGLEALDADRLFERFYRGDSSRRAGGSGLGLSIAASLAAAQGMALEASVDNGRFVIALSK